jgi:hypothetical protein
MATKTLAKPAITINDLPNEILCEIGNKLDIRDVVKLAMVNKKFYMLLKGRNILYSSFSPEIIKIRKTSFENPLF